MADEKVSQQPVVTTLADTDVFYVVTDEESESSKIAWSDVKAELPLNDFGDTFFVDPPSGSDDYASFLTAWNAANAVGLSRIIIPPGRYTIGTQLPVLTNGVAVEGSGSKTCQLVFDHADEGLQWNGVVNNSPVGNRRGPRFKGFAVLPGHAGSTTGIKASLASGGAPSYATAEYVDLNVDVNGTLAWVDKLIHNTDLPNAVFQNVAGAGTTTTYGLVVDGFAVGPRFIGCNVHLVDVSYHIGGTTEGGYFWACESILTNTGILRDNTSGQEPWLYVASCHFNSLVGIDITDTPEATIVGNLIWSSSDDWIGVRLRQSGGSTRSPRIHDNGFWGGNNVGRTGSVCIKCEQALQPIISDNLFYSADVGIEIGSAVADAKIGSGNQFNAVTSEIVNNSLTTRLGDRLMPVGTWTQSALRNAVSAPIIDIMARRGYA